VLLAAVVAACGFTGAAGSAAAAPSTRFVDVTSTPGGSVQSPTAVQGSATASSSPRSTGGTSTLVDQSSVGASARAASAPRALEQSIVGTPRHVAAPATVIQLNSSRPAPIAPGRLPGVHSKHNVGAGSPSVPVARRPAAAPIPSAYAPGLGMPRNVRTGATYALAVPAVANFSPGPVSTPAPISARATSGISGSDLLLPAPSGPRSPGPASGPPIVVSSGSSGPLNAGGIFAGMVALLAAMTLTATAFGTRRFADSPAPRRLELFAAAIDRPG